MVNVDFLRFVNVDFVNVDFNVDLENLARFVNVDFLRPEGLNQGPNLLETFIMTGQPTPPNVPPPRNFNFRIVVIVGPIFWGASVCDAKKSTFSQFLSTSSPIKN